MSQNYDTSSERTVLAPKRSGYRSMEIRMKGSASKDTVETFSLGHDDAPGKAHRRIADQSGDVKSAASRTNRFVRLE